MSNSPSRSLGHEFRGLHDAVITGIRISRHRAATFEMRPMVLECAKDLPPHEEFCIVFHDPSVFSGRNLELLNIIYDVIVRPVASVSDVELAQAYGLTPEKAAQAPWWPEALANVRSEDLQLAWIDSSIGLSGPLICRDVTVERADWMA